LEISRTTNQKLIPPQVAQLIKNQLTTIRDQDCLKSFRKWAIEVKSSDDTKIDVSPGGVQRDN
jgi:hypothetical protein